LLALKALGAQFSAYVTIQPHHRLIRHGIYARIRHPLYLSLLLLPVGIALVFNSELAALPLIMSVAFIWDRTRKEDYNLAAHFGSQFEDYRRQTPAILPWKIQ
jgi:protein-S-isoprenylcysteine O-methyltransferase